jgi:signal transduction histidine kinase
LDLGRYSKELEATVYFCVLEAMHNAAAHARAKSVQVLVADSGDEITFEVRDDGFGFDPGRSTRSGLTHMADRLEAMDGSLLVDSSPGHGTRVLGRIPASELVTT